MTVDENGNQTYRDPDGVVTVIKNDAFEDIKDSPFDNVKSFVDKLGFCKYCGGKYDPE